MKATHQSLHEVGSFSKMFLDYLSGNPSLSQFYAYEPKIEAFESAIKIGYLTAPKEPPSQQRLLNNIPA